MHRRIDTLYRSVRIEAEAEVTLRKDVAAILKESIAVTLGNNSPSSVDTDWFDIEIDGHETEAYVVGAITGHDVVYALILCSSPNEDSSDPSRDTSLLYVLVELYAKSMKVRQKTTVNVQAAVIEPWDEALSALLV